MSFGDIGMQQDVYKRQVYGPIYKAEINVHKQVPDSLQWSHRGSSFDNTIQAQKAVTLGAVSYTHLDVYKRQALYWSR